MKAKIKTKSNYRGLNGKFLEVKEMSGKRVTCLHFEKELNKTIEIDFQLKEIEELKPC